MSEHETPGTDRRTFLQSGALVTAAAIGSIPAAGVQEQPAKLCENADSHQAAGREQGTREGAMTPEL